ncbi:hypothetical protein Z517_02969 [Fonsecaea pedrosoi CBS 271.37]|uniref:Xylanolytic transcriptional activator regulatory domain-containing protein n=1 Tax=Fonsecaea pedrosoi CBS 271.37 TaxID=1442368 RepID=A0A0D2GRW2_9EURO|nr:uncharacterized protein Z517_02969 [Fonsecaea pedrosoi CBS 271.37]KIW83723.1 hypothetical protein Z517_02969 [Fonsecaea pedrosoi CBS 271.37]
MHIVPTDKSAPRIGVLTWAAGLPFETRFGVMLRQDFRPPVLDAIRTGSTAGLIQTSHESGRLTPSQQPETTGQDLGVYEGIAYPSAEYLSAPSTGHVSDTASDAHSEIYMGADWLLLSDAQITQHAQWSLGGAVLSYHDVSELLNFYAHNYYPHLPILDRVTSVADFHDSNVFLFWTLLRTACYRHPKFGHVFQLIARPYEQLLAIHLLSPIRDFRIIQAILILCHWPNTGSQQSKDPSWQYCGIAMNAALQMGLDQLEAEMLHPGSRGQSKALQMSVQSRRMTWLACFNTSTNLSVWFGIRPHLSSPSQLNATSSMAKKPSVPRHFMVQVELQRHVVQYSTALAGDVDSSTCSTLQSLFNTELDTLFTVYQDIWSPRLEIQRLGAKLYLFSLCLTVTSKQRSRPQELDIPYAIDLARVSVQLGLPAAVSLIHTIVQLNNESLVQEPGNGGVIHYPKFYFRLVVFAVVFLMKFLSADPRAAQQDRELAFSHITAAHQFFSSFAPAQDFARVAEVMADMARNLRVDAQDHPSTVETRLGASLLYDTMRRFRRPLESSGDSEKPAAPTVTDPNAWAMRSDNDGASWENQRVMDSSCWRSHDAVAYKLPELHANLEEGLDCFRWMSDDMLVEMMNL